MNTTTILYKTIILIITIVTTTLLISCNVNSELEKKNKKKAIELVKNYKAPTYVGDGMKIIDVLSFKIERQLRNGRIIEPHGWRAEKISSDVNQYTVSCEYRDIKTEKKIQWLVDIDREIINPLDKFAEDLMTKHLDKIRYLDYH